MLVSTRVAIAKQEGKTLQSPAVICIFILATRKKNKLIFLNNEWFVVSLSCRIMCGRGLQNKIRMLDYTVPEKQVVGGYGVQT